MSAGTRMTPRERVLAALQHRQPDRVPFSWGFGPTPEMTAVLEKYCADRGLAWARLRMAVEDVRSLGPRYIGPPPPEGLDIWGVRREEQRYDGGVYGEIAAYPLADVDTVAEIEGYPWPDPDAWAYERVRDEARAADPTRRYAGKLAGGNPFEIYCWMTGLEEAMVNILVAPEVVHAAMARITDYFAARVARTLEQCGELVDLVFYADDLGGQQGPLMSRETYRTMIQPYHRRLVDTAHRLAPHATIMLHSDGSVFELLPDLLDAGIDMLEAVQTDAALMEPARLKAAFGDRMSFHGALSVQQLLPHEEAATVEATCREIAATLGAGGGYIAAPTHAIQIGTPPENVFAMLRGVLGDEDYQAALAAAAQEEIAP